MFVVGRSGNKSLDELVEADPNRRGARLKKETAKVNKEKDVLARETQKEEERTGRRERARNGGIRRVLVSCYPVCNGEDSQVDFGDQSLDDEGKRDKRSEESRTRSVFYEFTKEDHPFRDVSIILVLPGPKADRKVKTTRV